jgi:hypothetical protein
MNLRRRDFITAFAGSAMALPLAAIAQQPKVMRIAVLMGIAETQRGKRALRHFDKAFTI